MDDNLRKSGEISEGDRFAGSIFSLVPAHSGSRAGAVAQKLSRTLTEGPGAAVLLADFQNPGQIDRARRSCRFVFADLSGATASQSAEVLRASQAIFLVAGSDRASLAAARAKAEWLCSIHVHDRCALLLTTELDGVSAAEAEQISGLPVCSLIDNQRQIARLAEWLRANASQPQALALAG